MSSKIKEEDYPLLKLPLVAGNFAAARKRRLFASAVREYVGFKSKELQDGFWSIDPETGDFINAKGQNIIEDLEFTINDPKQPRTHWEVPEIPKTEAEAEAKIWAEPDMTVRGALWKKLREYHKSDSLANAAYTESAARHGVSKPFTDQVGTTSGTRADEKPVAANNPYSDAWISRNGIEAFHAEVARLLPAKGIKYCTGLAAAAGKTATGAKLRP